MRCLLGFLSHRKHHLASAARHTERGTDQSPAPLLTVTASAVLRERQAVGN
jgi:hypothetical protein